MAQVTASRYIHHPVYQERDPLLPIAIERRQLEPVPNPLAQDNFDQVIPSEENVEEMTRRIVNLYEELLLSQAHLVALRERGANVEAMTRRLEALSAQMRELITDAANVIQEISANPQFEENR